jgi:diguanylate cyclase (GGDEF)-like protein
MNNALSTLPRSILGAATKIFRIARRIDNETLSRCILSINEMRDLDGIIDQASIFLRRMLNFRLYTVVLKSSGDFHLWADLNDGAMDIYQSVQAEFDVPEDVTVHALASTAGGCSKNENIRTFTLTNDKYSAKCYGFAPKKLSKNQKKVLDIIARTIGIAINNTLDMERLKKEAAFDRLTNAYSRREFDRIIEHSIANSQRHKRSLSIIMLDLDHFKNVNDVYGHLVGDTVLREVSKKLHESIRKGDYLARYGGEEFIVILPETKILRAMELAERLRKAIEDHRIAISPEKVLKITASFGVASLKSTSDKESLLHEADEMMYRAKEHGRNIVMPGVKLYNTNHPAFNRSPKANSGSETFHILIPQPSCPSSETVGLQPCPLATGGGR